MTAALAPWQQVKLAVIEAAFGIKALPEAELLHALEALCIKGVAIGVDTQRNGAPATEGANPWEHWPIACIRVDATGQLAGGKLYMPGLPPGEHDVWCLRVATPRRQHKLDSQAAKAAAAGRT